MLHEFFEEVLGLVDNRMKHKPMQDHLKRHLLGVILTAFAYNPTLTLAFLEARGETAHFFEQITEDKFSFTFVNTFERKTYIIGLTSALNAEGPMPPPMQHYLLKIIQSVIGMLNKLREQEARALRKAAQKEIKDLEEEDEEDDDYSDEEEEDEEPDEDMEHPEHSQQPDNSDEEEKRVEPSGLGFVDEDEKTDSDDELDEAVSDAESNRVLVRLKRDHGLA